MVGTMPTWPLICCLAPLSSVIVLMTRIVLVHRSKLIPPPRFAQGIELCVLAPSWLKNGLGEESVDERHAYPSRDARRLTSMT